MKLLTLLEIIGLKRGDKAVMWGGISGKYIPCTIVSDYNKNKKTYKCKFENGNIKDVPQNLLDYKHIKEEQSNSIQNAQLQKVRADRQQLSQQQKQLSQSRKNIKDTPTKARLSQQIADLGSKKAKLGVQVAQQSQTLKTKPKMNEGHPERIRLKELLPVEETLIYEADTNVVDDLLTIAKNERKFYDTRDAIGAIEFAVKILEKEELLKLRREIKLAMPLAKRQLADYWSREDKNR